jgi:hypothetical protein
LEHPKTRFVTAAPPATAYATTLTATLTATSPATLATALTATLTAALLLLASPALADDPPPVAPARAADAPPAFEIGSKPVWFVTGGVTSGATIVAHDAGGYVGGELSIVRLREGRFLGFYGDTYYDLGAHRTYATSGLELGYKFFGLDGGAATRIGGDRLEWGPTGRVFMTIGILSVYGRYAYFVDPLASGNDHVVQIGGLFKLPFAAWGGGR